jgi:hypothetical protein
LGATGENKGARTFWQRISIIPILGKNEDLLTCLAGLRSCCRRIDKAILLKEIQLKLGRYVYVLFFLLLLLLLFWSAAYVLFFKVTSQASHIRCSHKTLCRKHDANPVD